jgi:hypothetical protein
MLHPADRRRGTTGGRRALLAVVAAVVVAVLATADPATAGVAGDPHYPDLQNLPPFKLRVKPDRATGQKLLRFSITIANLGDGPLELRPQNDPSTGLTQAFQRVYTHDAAGAWSLWAETPAGTFVFHPTHFHWHFEGFALYEIRDATGAVIRSSTKISFCIADTTLVDPNLPHASAPVYRSCQQSAIQGLSVGLGDTYELSVPGQSIDITGLPDGDYLLVSTADPDDHVLEVDDGNNVGSVAFRLTGKRVMVLPGP